MCVCLFVRSLICLFPFVQLFVRLLVIVSVYVCVRFCVRLYSFVCVCVCVCLYVGLFDRLVVCFPLFVRYLFFLS